VASAARRFFRRSLRIGSFVKFAGGNHRAISFTREKITVDKRAKEGLPAVNGSIAGVGGSGNSNCIPAEALCLKTRSSA